jgi:5-methylcytosine-specific restriction endonuclease McrA
MKLPTKFRPNRFKNKKIFNERDNAPYLTPEWRKYRFRFLHHNPKCYACGMPSSQVEHLHSVRNYPEKFKELTNHIPLCHGCHSTITINFDQDRKCNVEGKLKWFADERLKRNLTFGIKVLPKYES